MVKKAGKHYTPNDQRSIVKNQTSKEFVMDQINRANQLISQGNPPPKEPRTKLPDNKG